MLVRLIYLVVFFFKFRISHFFHHDRKGIGLVVTNFDKGGLEQTVLNLYRGFRKNGFDAYILVKNNQIGDIGKSVYSPSHLRIFNNDERSFYDFCFRKKIGVLHYHYCTFGMRVSFLLGFKQYYTIHNTYLWFSKNDWVNYKKLLKYCLKIFAVSDLVKDYFIRKTGFSNVITIENGIDVDSISEGEQFTKNRGDYGFTSNDIVFVHLASINEAKHQMILVGAMERLIRKLNNVYLLFLGNTLSFQYLSLLQKAVRVSSAQSNIRFVKYIPQNQIGDFLKKVPNIQVLPSLYEGFPLSVLEGLVCKLPIITTDIGLPNDELAKKVIFKIPNAYKYLNTLTVDDIFEISKKKNARNVDELAEKMLYVAKNLKNIKECFIDWDYSIYDLDTMVEKYIQEMFEN